MLSRVDPATPVPKFLPNLQIARFLAAFVVMIGHLQYETRDLGIMASGPLVDFKPIYTPAGIDVFFVISGFIMYYLARDRFAEPGYWRTFLVRRLVRIVPLYWAFLVLMLAVIAVLGNRLNNNNLDPAHIVASFLFVPWPRIDGNVVPVLSSGWTLNYEMLFYALFAVALTMRPRRAIGFLCGTLIALAAIGPLVPRALFVLDFWTDTIVLDFLAGIGLAMLFVRGHRVTRTGGLVLIALGGAMLVLSHQWMLVQTAGRFVGAGIPGLFVCAGLVLSPAPDPSRRIGRLLVLGGDASYSLYLSHPFTLNALAILWERAGLNAPYLYFAVALVLCVAVSVAIYRWFESPVIAYLNRRLAPRPASPIAARQF